MVQQYLNVSVDVQHLTCHVVCGFPAQAKLAAQQAKHAALLAERKAGAAAAAAAKAAAQLAAMEEQARLRVQVQVRHRWFQWVLPACPAAACPAALTE